MGSGFIGGISSRQNDNMNIKCSKKLYNNNNKIEAVATLQRRSTYSEQQNYRLIKCTGEWNGSDRYTIGSERNRS